MESGTTATGCCDAEDLTEREGNVRVDLEGGCLRGTARTSGSSDGRCEDAGAPPVRPRAAAVLRTRQSHWGSAMTQVYMSAVNDIAELARFYDEPPDGVGVVAYLDRHEVHASFFRRLVQREWTSVRRC